MEAFSDGVLAIIITIMVLELRRDWKGKVSVVIYLVAIPLAFLQSRLACLLYVFVAVMWLIPDRRIEKTLIAGGG